MARKELYRRWGKIDDVATACGVGRHRSTECYEYTIKPLEGNLRVKHGVVSLRKFRRNQHVYFWEDKTGKIYDVVPKIE